MQTGRERDQVARTINDRDVAGVAIVAGIARGRDLYRTMKRRRITGEFFCGTRTKREGGRAFIDQGAAFGGIFFREQTRVRDFDKIHIAEILFAIREGKLDGFDAGMNVIGAVVAHRLQVVAFQNLQRK